MSSHHFQPWTHHQHRPQGSKETTTLSKRSIKTCWTSRLRSDCASLATERPYLVLISRVVQGWTPRCNRDSRHFQAPHRSQATWCLVPLKTNHSNKAAYKLTICSTRNSLLKTLKRWQAMLPISFRASTATSSSRLARTHLQTTDRS